MRSTTTLGKLLPGQFGLLELPKLDRAIVEGFLALPDLTGMISDAMDDLGLEGVVPASVLAPTNSSRRIVGRALTVENRRLTSTVAEAIREGRSRLGEIEAHNLAEPGDVLVIQGLQGVSSMGGISASIGLRQGEIGAVVDGAVRDTHHSRTIGYPIWSRGVSPITGKWRIETASINRPVSICSVTVSPGDLVAADETGVCFVPREATAAVLARAQAIGSDERARLAEIDRGVSIAKLTPRRSTPLISTESGPGME
jgi:4-hydroxy-4-methyl-2-oxoglutarate aldolase